MYGNLSNVFGHALTILFFVWWAGRRVGGWPVGAALLVLGCTSHLGTCIALVCLVAALVIWDRKTIRRDRTALLAVAVGFGLAFLYYSHFVGMIVAQLPRLAEGGGSGKAAESLWDRLIFEARWARVRWGLPLTALALIGWPLPSRSDFERRLAAFASACVVLFLAALVSPLDVRYLYVWSPVIAICAATGVSRLAERGTIPRLLAFVLILAVLWVPQRIGERVGQGGLATIHEALFLGYR